VASGERGALSEAPVPGREERWNGDAGRWNASGDGGRDGEAAPASGDACAWISWICTDFPV
jgi:hypothetical protein